MTVRLSQIAVVIALGAPTVALAYDEATTGDLSSDPSAPTAVSFSLGGNTVKGRVTSRQDMPDSRDYLRFTVPAGQRLTALRLVRYEDENGGAGNAGFHAINTGATSYEPSFSTRFNFLGGDHLFPLRSGTDTLPDLADGGTAGVGFSVPLGAGTYSYVIQQAGPDISVYELQFVLSAAPAPAVPAAGASRLALLAAGLLLGALFVGRRRSMRR